MKRILFLAGLLLLSMGLFAQEVTTLTFTAKQQNNTYQQLDSVVVTNLTKEWTEVIRHPDTLLLMNTVGITDWENSKGSVKLYQNIPNPFHGITDFNLTLANKEKVELVIFDINGKKVAEYHNTLPSGEHMFRATMNTSQTYLLSAVTKNGNTSIKMINLGNTGAQAHIEYVSSKPLDMDMTKKQSQNPFDKGDDMKYVGYATQNDGSHDATLTQIQQGSETITFTFPTETQNPIVQAFTDDATTITQTSATLNGHYNVVYADVDELGFEYKKAGDTEFTPIYVTTKNSPFSHNLVGLENGTEYVFKAFVKADSTIAYGEEKSFTTEKVSAELPEVTTVKAQTDNSMAFTLKGTVVSEGYCKMKKRGFFWGKDANPKENGKKQIVDLGTDKNFSFLTKPLEPATKYYYVAFATNEKGTAYGEVMDFTTREAKELAVVNINNVTAFSTKATVESEVVSSGEMVTERGICFSTKGEPTIADKKLVDAGTGLGIFTTEMARLAKSTEYRVRAYAISWAGTAYSETKTFTTDSGFICGSKIQDIDGNSYATVKIGEQCWMQENLRTKTMPNGTPIKLNTEGTTPGSFAVGNYWYFEVNDEYTGDNVLYPWSTASNVSSNSDQNAKIQGICPDGWYLPTYRDYAILCNYIDPGFDINKTYSKNTVIASNNKLGIKLALPQGTGEGYGHWVHYAGPGYVGANMPGGSGTHPEYAQTPNSPGYNFPDYVDSDFNASGFSAKPKGYLWRYSYKYMFNGALNLWSSISTGVEGAAVCFKVSMNCPGITYCTYEDVAKDFYSVRCLKGDDPVPEDPEEDACEAIVTIHGEWTDELSATLVVDGEDIAKCDGNEKVSEEVKGKVFQIVVKQSIYDMKELTPEHCFTIEFPKTGVKINSEEYLEEMNSVFGFTPIITIKCGEVKPTIKSASEIDF